MRIVHSRKKVFEQDNAFINKFTLLVWILSVLKWKEYGDEVVLYTDNETLEKIQEFGFHTLYDEIDTSYFENEEICKEIDFYWFWAMPKILALKHEVLDLGNDVVIADMDVVPMSDVSRMWKNTDIAVWSNKEFVENHMVYPKLNKLSLPKDYNLPEWFTGQAKPLNTGVIHIKDKKIVELFTNEAFKMVRNNRNELENTQCQTMCNVEQRLLGEIVTHKNLTYSVMQPINQGLFNRNAFHTHGYKTVVRNHNGLLWNCNLLNMIKKSNKTMFNKLISNDFFKDEREYLNANANVEQMKELAIYGK